MVSFKGANYQEPKYRDVNSHIITFKEFEIFLWKKDAFECAGIRGKVFRFPVYCSNHLSYTGARHTSFRRKTLLYRFSAKLYGCDNFKLRIDNLTKINMIVTIV